MHATATTTGGTVMMDQDGAADLFEQICLSSMGISSDEFLVRWDRGDFEGRDWDSVPGLVDAATSIALVRH